MIRLEGVSRRFRDGANEVSALADVNLEIPAGATVALTGKSGSGKSTLLHLIGGMDWPTAGRITVDGFALHELDDPALTRFRLTRVGFVFQFFHLLPALSLMENLLLPAELAGLRAGAARERARALLREVGLEERSRSYPDRLSGGEQQRVAIARSLMLEPPILLADEPTGNLDSDTGGRVLDLFLRLSRERGATLLVATHSREVGARMARQVELRDGTVQQDSTAQRDSAAQGDSGPEKISRDGDTSAETP
ncbi:MAG: ABC transporter ATP-binding protein [SAR324 cluster bacterium]|nr:ABC transporter ATP-binding protein [SAR324 cluster bacterium]